MPAERQRIEEASRRERHWRRWGPYLSERQWGTVREDYSPYGTAWEYLPHDHARSRAYRWGEDGISGWSDNHQRLCFALALWNGRDPILKERLYGVTGNEGNHGEDVKELYYYLDATPTYSYAKSLYKYPQTEFPYAQLAAEADRRDKRDPEFELLDTGVFADDRYWDVYTEYAKADVDDLAIRITVCNRGPETATLHLLPTLWFANSWSWDRATPKPSLRAASPGVLRAEHADLGAFEFWLQDDPPLWFTGNDTNVNRHHGWNEPGPFKDAFHELVIHGNASAARRDQGTKACGWYQFTVPAGQSRTVRLRLAPQLTPLDMDALFTQRQAEADEFYSFQPATLTPDARSVQRQAFAGLLWSKQHYYYVVDQWLKGDPAQPPPPPERERGRNHSWTHLYIDNVLTMPDKWEYPWFATWDTCFHMIPLALVDPQAAKDELSLFLREWYMHPNGQVPAYEWNFEDVNPPVNAWSVYRVYKIDGKLTGKPDHKFLEAAFHKLLMNFTWWVNRKDTLGDNIFEGGFLGLDNIGLFDRSRPLPAAGLLEQSDGTSWMAMYCLNMLRIAIELSRTDRVYEDIASKFFEHFLYIASAMNRGGGAGLWDEDDGFYYDRIRMENGVSFPLKVRSMVGLIPLFAVETIDGEVLAQLHGFRRRMEWFQDHRSDLCANVASISRHGVEDRRLLALVMPARLRRILARMLDETEFLSPHGIRSLSRAHRDNPYTIHLDGSEYRVGYEPAESTTYLFGGNSNWRGPVWFPVNYLLIESLQKFNHYFGDEFTIEFPTGSGRQITLGEAAAELSRRLSRLFLRSPEGRRPVYGGTGKLQSDPHFRDHILFYEYFHGDNGAGIGASHQTGWTALVAKLLQQSGC
ncbi:MAG: glucosidase [Acidobacteria bacterium]|nr:glucosidase [Acidobacteriota bacterium]